MFKIQNMFYLFVNVDFFSCSATATDLISNTVSNIAIFWFLVKQTEFCSCKFLLFAFYFVSLVTKVKLFFPRLL